MNTAQTIAVAFAPIVAFCGGLLVAWRHWRSRLSEADAHRRVANQVAGKLSRIIFRQRRKINQLRTLLPPIPKDERIKALASRPNLPQ